MGPLGFLTGVLLGSSASIAGVLAMVLVMFMLVSSDHPNLIAEYGPLIQAVVIFAVLAAVAGLAFVGLQKGRSWRWLAQGAMWLLLAGIAWSYWPEGAA